MSGGRYFRGTRSGCMGFEGDAGAASNHPRLDAIGRCLPTWPTSHALSSSRPLHVNPHVFADLYMGRHEDAVEGAFFPIHTFGRLTLVGSVSYSDSANQSLTSLPREPDARSPAQSSIVWNTASTSSGRAKWKSEADLSAESRKRTPAASSMGIIDGVFDGVEDRGRLRLDL